MSSAVAERLRGAGAAAWPTVPDAVLDDEDCQLALWMLFELHFRGFDDADTDLEWDPDLIALRGDLEARMEAELRAATRGVVDGAPDSGDLAEDLFAFIGADDAPSVASYLHRHATAEQVREYLRDKSVYALKESDAHSFVLGRLDGPAKAALAEIQYDEYGSGRPESLHSTLYAQTLEAAGLDPTYGAYLHEMPVETLAVNNLHPLLAMRRRLRGASMGQMATFEATSSSPCRRIAAGIERVGLPAEAAVYFHEHVEADAVHEQVALRDVCAGLVQADPSLREDVLFGAAACLHLDGVWARRILARWGALPAFASTTSVQVAS
ncbi:iron-containing redox enzyme family protein [Mobilicoccus pelagius]|uniref:iron-containing redox enzyme family protein n=1 Tax=Mobilicoccus pelagius TaxID=746032 RepID=UPI0003165DDF|nr:iron-containing redox enzyme family protein [Mobilicoccus pelagius]